MATMKINLPNKDEIGVIRYLLDEIEERKYNEEYDIAYTRAHNIAKKRAVNGLIIWTGLIVCRDNRL